jgi:Tfp pilus assembly protein PilF
MEDLVKKLEEASAKDPNNADLHFNLATTYLSIANPKDGKKPANSAELYTKSEESFTRAIKASPDNSGFNYNFGALYFNQATDFNDQINAITGSSKADQDKYESLKAKRDGLFAKAAPYFEKSYSVLSPNDAKLQGEDLRTYKSTVIALNKIYILQGKTEKASEMKKILDTL